MPESVGPKTLDVPELGIVTRDDRFGWYASGALYVPVLGRPSRFILDAYADEDLPAEFQAAIAHFLRLDGVALRAADEPLFRYYRDFESFWLEEGNAPITSADELWSRVELGREPTVTRRAYGDRGVYVSVECECEWEPEHGLQLVFKNGQRINKLGGYDGHLTNADAYADPRLEDVVYHPIG